MTLYSRRSALALIWGLAAMFAGCATSPAARFYTLAPLPAVNAGTNRAAPISISVSHISLPEFMDRPQLVLNLDEHRVQLLENHRWAEPLKSAIPRVMAANLSRMLGTDRVSWYPQSSAYGADYRVLADFQQFETSAEYVTVDALWSVRSKADKPVKNGRSRIREQIGGTGYEATAAAYSRALAVMSKDIATAIRPEPPAAR